MIKLFKQEYTEKFPYRYFVQTENYTVSTCNKANYDKLVTSFEFSEKEEFQTKEINKLLIAGFTVVMNK